jgi:hypothetical protein
VASEPYRERAAWPVWVHLFVLFCAGAALLGVRRTVLRNVFGAEALVGLAVAAAIVFVWWRMRHLFVEFGPEGAAFGFGGPARRVPASRIVAARPEDYRVVQYMGWGWRIGAGTRDRAYSVIGYRRGVRLEFEDERGRRWSVFLACSDPESACAALPDSVRKSSGPDRVDVT